MHELGIATEIINIVQHEMIKRHLDKIKTIGLRIGALSGVDPEALTFGFQAATMDTPLTGTELAIEHIPVQGSCKSCDKEFEVKDFIFICPHCDSRDIQIMHGEELDISYLEE